jgi:hypothetical protein
LYNIRIGSFGFSSLILVTRHQELDPGNRVEQLGNFGKPTGELGTVERTNEDDAIVKWDDDGRTRVHQPWLKKA